MRKTECCRHFEIMTVSFRPHYPGPDFTLAPEHITDSYNRAVNQPGEQPVFLLGDFNKCNVTTHLPYLEQYVTVPTRMHNRLDLCYGNIPDAYILKPCPPIGRSDHKVIQLLPKYRSQLKRGAPLKKNN